MTTAALEASLLPPTRRSAHQGELAAALQEAFTVAVRLRAGRHVATDAGSFRAQIKQVLSLAGERARGSGYSAAIVKQAIYGYIALLDELVLSSTQPMFSGWSRQPLQEEIFGDHMAGENFFRSLHDALSLQDSDEVADLLEVFQLCLFLGFHGRYGSDAASVRSVQATLHSKIQRIRGGNALSNLAPDWRRPENERVVAAKDPWARRLAVIAASALAVAIVLYVVYSAFLATGVNALRKLV